MAITSTAAVDAEYASRRETIVGYPSASLDQDLARLDVLAAAIREAVDLLRAREALHERAFSNLALENAAGQITGASQIVRTAVASAQANLPI